MKSRRKLTYQLLALEVVRQLQARFAPKDPDIKGCVDLLIDKEFLERLDDGSLGYLA
jgi:cullin 1